MLQRSIAEVSRYPVAVDESAARKVWVGHLQPANDDSANPLVFVVTPSMDKTCQAVIREMRAEDETSAIIAFCTGASEEKILALKAGADDCIAAPEGIIDALRLLESIGVRRSRLTDRAAGLHRIMANPHTHGVTVDGSAIVITPMEFRLLLELQRQRGKVVTHQHLENLLWGATDALSRQALKQLARRLRRRLGTAGDSVVLVRGVGYMLT